MQNRLKVFISYKHVENPEGKQPLRDEVIEFLRQNQFEPIYDESAFVAGIPWRPQIYEKLQESDCVLVLWSQASEWILVEATIASILKKPYLFMCFDGINPPAPFQDTQAIKFAKKVTTKKGFDGYGKVLNFLENVPINNTSTQNTGNIASTSFDIARTTQEIEIFRATLFSILQDPYSTDDPENLRSRFEGVFSRPHATEELLDAQTKIVENIIELDRGDKLAELFADSDVLLHLRYNVGYYAGQLKCIPDKDILSLTETLRLGNSKFQAMRHLVTQGTYSRFNKQEHKSYPYWYYLPWCPIKAGDAGEKTWLKNVRKFISWLEREENWDGARLPTYDEWCLLAKASHHEWKKVDILEKCNLHRYNSDGNLISKMSAVGFFPGSKSDVDCFDIIGNVWELCYEDSNFDSNKLLVVGWAYNSDIEFVTLANRWDEAMYLDEAFSNSSDEVLQLPVGFRLVVPK